MEVKKHESKKVKAVCRNSRLLAYLRKRLYPDMVACASSMALLKRILTAPIKLWQWTTDYTGFGAELVKAIPVALLAIIWLYPIWSYGLIWLPLAQSVSPLWQTVIYVWCWVQTGLIVFFSFVIGYVRENR